MTIASRDISANTALSNNDGAIYADPSGGTITITEPPAGGMGQIPAQFAFWLHAGSGTDASHKVVLTAAAPHTSTFEMTAPGSAYLHLVNGTWRQLA